MAFLAPKKHTHWSSESRTQRWLVAAFLLVMLPAVEVSGYEHSHQQNVFYTPVMKGGHRSQEATLRACRNRCAKMDGCMYFSRHLDGACYLMDHLATKIHAEGFQSGSCEDCAAENIMATAMITPVPAPARQLTGIVDPHKKYAKHELQRLSECYERNMKFLPSLPDEDRSVEMSARDCQLRCAATTGCVRFSHWSVDGGCQLAGVDAKPMVQLGVFTGPAHCKPQCFVPHTRYTPTMSYEGVTTELSGVMCQKRCQGTYGCRYFFFELDTGNCQLSDIHGIRVTDPDTNLVAGPQFCGATEVDCYNRHYMFIPSMEGHTWQHNARRCQAMCTQVSSCSHFSYNTVSQHCFLHKHNATKIYSKDWYSGPAFCPKCSTIGLAFRPNMDGVDATREANTTMCQKRCASTPSCEHFTYVIQEGDCLLQDGSAHEVSTTGVVSGPPDCASAALVAAAVVAGAVPAASSSGGSSSFGGVSSSSMPWFLCFLFVVVTFVLMGIASWFFIIWLQKRRNSGEVLRSYRDMEVAASAVLEASGYHQVQQGESQSNYIQETSQQRSIEQQDFVWTGSQQRSLEQQNFIRTAPPPRYVEPQYFIQTGYIQPQPQQSYIQTGYTQTGGLTPQPLLSDVQPQPQQDYIQTGGWSYVEPQPQLSPVQTYAETRDLVPIVVETQPRDFIPIVVETQPRDFIPTVVEMQPRDFVPTVVETQTRDFVPTIVETQPQNFVPTVVDTEPPALEPPSTNWQIDQLTSFQAFQAPTEQVYTADPVAGISGVY